MFHVPHVYGNTATFTMANSRLRAQPVVVSVERGKKTARMAYYTRIATHRFVVVAPVRAWVKTVRVVSYAR